MFFQNSRHVRLTLSLECHIRRKSTVIKPAEELQSPQHELLKEKALPDVKSNEYQFIQRSKIPTLHFQESLPRLPVPKLHKTCQRYLAAQAPILSAEDFQTTKKLVEDFESGEGKILQEALLKYNSMYKRTSYISKPWFDMYLTDRTPLPINFNPAIVFNKSVCPENNSQLHRATNMVISSLRFFKALQAKVLAPEVFHLNPEKSDTNLFKIVTGMLPSSLSWYGAYLFQAYPLDMSQYSSLFNSTRIPQVSKDALFRYQTVRHILVLRLGHFFKVDVFDSNGDILPPEQIFACLKHILESDLKSNTDSVGILTTENRDSWAKTRRHLINVSGVNIDTLSDIDSAAFVLCLDDTVVGSDREKIMRNFLHGDGLNRWYDKSFSLQVTKDGVAAVNFEHSWGDGVAVLRYLNEIFSDIDKNCFVNFDTNPGNVSTGDLVKEIGFCLDEKAVQDVREAKEKFDTVCNSLGINTVEFPGFGKTDCKVAQISPDSFMQSAFQVAYHKLTGEFVGSYESCSTAAFKHGRTETIRPCTEATSNLARAVNGKNKPGIRELAAMMKKCSEVHGKLTKEAAMGQGFDRHLFGLRQRAFQLNLPLPELFLDDAYHKINHNIISTSTLSSPAVLLGGFGPVVANGLGIGYGISNDFCGSLITSYPARRNGADFADALLSTFKELSQIIIQSQNTRK